MSTLATLLVKLGISADGYESGLEKAAKKTETSLAKITRAAEGMSRVGNIMTLAVSTPLAALGGKAIQAASDTSEALNKMQVVFGRASGGVQAFAQNSAKALGMSKAAAYEATGTFGNLFTSMGLGVKPAADMSTGLVQLAADLASFNNIDPSLALEKLRAGMVGEVEPLRTLGINLSAAAVEVEALRMGFVKTGPVFSNSALMAARYSLVMKQSANAQGDFARTSEGLANKTRTAKAELLDAAATLGEKLIPMAITATGKVSDLANAFNGLDGGTQSLIVDLGLVAIVAGPIVKAFGAILSVGAKLAPVISAIGTGVTALVGWLALAIAGMTPLADKLARVFSPSESTTQELATLTNALAEAQQNYNNALATGNETSIRLAGNRVAAITAQIVETHTLVKAEYQAAAVLPDMAEKLRNVGSTSDKVLPDMVENLRSVGAAALNASSDIASLDFAVRNLATGEEISVQQASPILFGANMSDPIDMPTWQENLAERQATYQQEVAARIAADQRGATATQNAYESAWGKIASYAESALSGAQSDLEGLLNNTALGKTGGNKPGEDGPFENLFRAADIAVNGDKSPWAAKLGLDQATASQIVNDFRKGLLTDQVKALIDIPALVQQVQTSQLAEQLKTKFAQDIAAAAGTGPNVVESLLGFQQTKPGESAIDVSGPVDSLVGAVDKGLGGKTNDIIQIGVDFMTNLGKGIAKAKEDLVKTVEDVANAMLDAMRAALNVDINPPEAPTAPAAPSGTANPTGFSAPVAQAMAASAGATTNSTSNTITIHQTLPPGTSVETQRAARQGSNEGVMAALAAMGVKA